MPAYLDHAASTPMRPEALDAMLPYLRDHYANPSGAHTMAREARKAIDQARDDLAVVLGAEPREVVFTSGGTEADNLAVLGVHDKIGGVPVGSAIEHHAVLEPLRARGGRLLPVDGRGIVDVDGMIGVLDEIAASGERVSLVSIVLANNEVGTVQPLPRLANAIRRHAPGALIHTDAVQAVTWLDVAVLTEDADLVSISGHKFGGPKGVGALVVRERVAGKVAPRALGGGQERERRSGTPDVAGIVAMATAARLASGERADTVVRVGALRDRLVDGLVAAVPDLFESGVPATRPADRAHKVAGAGPVAIEGIESETLIVLLEKDGVYASAGASCASGAAEPSHVLAAMGVARPRAEGALRLSLGAASSAADVDLALEVIPDAVARLREAS